MYYFLKIFFLLALVTAASASPDTIQIGSFTESGLTGWSEKLFKGATEYRIVEDAGQKVLQAKSQGAASGLIFKTEYDPHEYPILSWRWKVGNTIAKGDSRTQAGDDTIWNPNLVTS